MAKDLAIFLPTRKGSERVLNKNTKPFSAFKNGLLELKLTQLQALPGIKTYLSTNDEESIEVGESFKTNGMNLMVVHRPEELCTSETKLKDLISYVPQIVEEGNILWTHVTSPFVDSSIYLKSIEQYFEDSSRDSLMSVTRIQEFLWSEHKGGFVNFKRNFGEWPRTQDLDKLFAVNSAIFIASKKTYLQGDRIGQNPGLLELNAKQSIDVDWEDDFELAETIHRGSN